MHIQETSKETNIVYSGDFFPNLHSYYHPRTKYEGK